MAKSNSTASTTVEETSTPLANAPTTASTAEGVKEAEAATDAPAPGEKKVSAYKKRMEEKGLDALMMEAPKELLDMARAAAEKDGGISLASWARKIIAAAVNSADLTHEVEGAQVAWQFNAAVLDATPARSPSTRGGAPLTEEEKAKRAEEKKKTEKEEREWVKEQLRIHRAKLRGESV